MAILKKLTMILVAALGMAAATGAQASTGTLEFDGFTISYAGTGFWEKVGTVYNATTSYDNYGYNWWTGTTYTSGHGGVQYNSGSVAFGQQSSFEFESAAGRGNDAAHSTFSYSIEAKSGWQLTGTGVNTSGSGTFLQYKGGSASITGSSNTYVDGGGSYDYGGTNTSTITSSASLKAGNWNSSYYQYAYGNNVTSEYKNTYNTYGNFVGYSVVYSASNYYQPLMSAAGSFNQDLSVSTIGSKQIAFIDGTVSPVSVSASAIRTVSPVPEPESYAMMAMGLAAVGVLARRKAKKAA